MESRFTIFLIPHWVTDNGDQVHFFTQSAIIVRSEVVWGVWRRYSPIAKTLFSYYESNFKFEEGIHSPIAKKLFSYYKSNRNLEQLTKYL